MNPMTNVKNIKKLSEQELKGRNKTSWHEQYKNSAWIFVGGLPYDLTEGDVLCIFSQYGEPVNINLVRDKDTGKSKGFCFLCYEDQRSTNLAVDNLNGIKVLSRTIRVDHVENYKPPKSNKDEMIQMALAPKKHQAEMGELNKGKVQKDSDSSDVSSDKSEKRKKKQKKKQTYTGSSDSEEKHVKKKRRKYSESLKKKRKKRTNDETYGDNGKKARKRYKSESSTSESGSSFTSSSSENEKKPKKSKKSKKEEQKRSRTIDELKREARLIQEELQRRHKAEEKANATLKKGRRTSPEKQPLRKESRKFRSRSRDRTSGKRSRSRSRSRSRDNDRNRYKETTKEKRENRERYSSSPRRDSRRRSRSESNDRSRQNGHRRQCHRRR